MNIPWIIMVVLVALGFLTIVLEFFLPGMALGAVGGFMMLLAVVAGFLDGPSTGVITLLTAAVSTAVAVILGMRIVPETPITLRQQQGTDEGFVAGPGGLEALAGKRGRSVTVLRPAGIVEIDGRKVDVVTEGDMIEAGTDVEVLKVDGNRVVVRARRGA